MTGETPAQVTELNVDGDFEAIVQSEFDPAFHLGAPAILEVPFGMFTPESAPSGQFDTSRAAMATSTGYTGNNCEESA